MEPFETREFIGTLGFTRASFIQEIHVISYPKLSVTEVDSRLNSATGTPLAATCGANIAAGYTTDEVPTTRQRSHFSSSLAVES
jgi:hypothetical protein